MALSREAPDAALDRPLLYFDECTDLFSNPENWRHSDIRREGGKRGRTVDTLLCISAQGNYSVFCAIVKHGVEINTPRLRVLGRLGHVLFAFTGALGIIDRNWQQDKPFATAWSGRNYSQMAYEQGQSSTFLMDEEHLYFQYRCPTTKLRARAMMNCRWIDFLIQHKLFEPSSVLFQVKCLQAALFQPLSASNRAPLSPSSTVDAGRGMIHRMAECLLRKLHSSASHWESFTIDDADSVHFTLRDGRQAFCLISVVLEVHGNIALDNLNLVKSLK